MSTLKKDDYGSLELIVPDHWLRIVEALDGTRQTDIIIAGTLTVPEEKFTIGETLLTATAGELNTLHERTPGTTEANKPIIPDNDRAIDYVRVDQLSVRELILDAPEVANATGKVYAHNNFY